jgi:hypothetical protein
MRDCLDRIEWWLRKRNGAGIGFDPTPTHHEVRIKVDTKKGPKAALVNTNTKTLIAVGTGATVGDALANLCTVIGAPT